MSELPPGASDKPRRAEPIEELSCWRPGTDPERVLGTVSRMLSCPAMIVAPAQCSLSMERNALDRVRRHCLQAYPHEGCGILGGRILEDCKEIQKVVPSTNSSTDRKRDRYLIAPEFHRKADRELKRLGLRIIGFFHSHPEVSAAPSRTDLAYAWPHYSYLILSLRAGAVGDIRSWTRPSLEDPFREERVLLRPRLDLAKAQHE